MTDLMFLKFFHMIIKGIMQLFLISIRWIYGTAYKIDLFADTYEYIVTIFLFIITLIFTFYTVVYNSKTESAKFIKAVIPINIIFLIASLVLRATKKYRNIALVTTKTKIDGLLLLITSVLETVIVSLL